MIFSARRKSIPDVILCWRIEAGNARMASRRKVAPSTMMGILKMRFLIAADPEPTSANASSTTLFGATFTQAAPRNITATKSIFFNMT